MIFTNNNKKKNNYDNVYGATIMTKVFVRVHPVHLMNVNWALGGCQPSDQGNRLGLWIRLKLTATINIHHHHCYYYSAHKVILILPSHEGWKAESIWALQERCIARARCCIPWQLRSVIQTWGLGHLTPQSGVLTTRLLRPILSYSNWIPPGIFAFNDGSVLRWLKFQLGQVCILINTK